VTWHDGYNRMEAITPLAYIQCRKIDASFYRTRRGSNLVHGAFGLFLFRAKHSEQFIGYGSLFSWLCTFTDYGYKYEARLERWKPPLFGGGGGGGGGARSRLFLMASFLCMLACHALSMLHALKLIGN